MTGNHEHWTDRLSAHLDGDLPAAEARAVDDHLQRCETCRVLRDELEAVRRRAGELPGLEPPRDLWLAIEARLGEDPLSEKVIPLPTGRRAAEDGSEGPARFAVSLPQAAAAALVLVAGGWLTGAMLTEPAGPPDASMPGNELLRVADETAGETGPMSQRLETLELALRDRLETVEPETRATLLRNLEVIDRAIRESLEALSEEPGNDYLRTHLGRALDRKQEYLERMTTLLEA